MCIDGNDLWCANAGDSRAIIVRKDGSIVPLSYDHKPDDKREKERIQKAGMTVTNGRINGDIAVSRSIGDFRFKGNNELDWKQQALTAYPDV